MADPVLAAVPISDERPARRVEALSLREALRHATADVHARLHRHPGFAAVASGRIDAAQYRRLLLRLYGFYLPFEAAAGLGRQRSGWLASDLAALGIVRPEIARIASHDDLPRLHNGDAVLGAMYVVEGSALGGRGLARQLRGLFGDDSLAGRRFFASDGADAGHDWRAFADTLTTVPASARHNVITAAVATFCSFEAWMVDWEAVQSA